MPMLPFSENLKQTLERALTEANSRLNEYMTLEHLLLAMIEDQDALPVLQGCEVDLEKLRTDLVGDLDTHLRVADNKEKAKPTVGADRVLRGAQIRAVSRACSEVTGADVLVSLYFERESNAVYYLQEQDFTRYDAVNFIAHGITKAPVEKETPMDDAKKERQLAFLDRGHMRRKIGWAATNLTVR